jgi:hypothetical protein
METPSAIPMRSQQFDFGLACGIPLSRKSVRPFDLSLTKLGGVTDT